jgi:hypothetical protein
MTAARGHGADVVTAHHHAVAVCLIVNPAGAGGRLYANGGLTGLDEAGQPAGAQTQPVAMLNSVARRPWLRPHRDHGTDIPRSLGGQASGLGVGTINQMLSSPELPPHVRATILTYVEEKLAGLYGHNKEQ